MRILVTGGAGYIGSVVCEELQGRGHDLVVYDNLAKGHRDAIDPAVPLVEGDIRDIDRLRRTLERQRTEAVVHLAAVSLVGESVVEPAGYWETNVTGGLVLLDAMRGAGVRRMVFSSTAAVYGEPERVPIDEAAPARPTNPYGATKWAFERALADYGSAYGLQHVSLRYFNAAGATARNGEEHDPETHLVPIVLQVALGARPHVSVYGDDYPTPDGTCVRDYVHVVDLAAAHVLALEALAAGGGVAPVYNLGNGDTGYSVLEVIEAARRVTGQPIPARTGPRRPGDPAVLIASSARIQAELGWRPRHPDLESIVRSAWDWMRRRAAAAPRAAAPEARGGTTNSA
jgi:UDP-glucose 4-epimerase